MRKDSLEMAKKKWNGYFFFFKSTIYYMRCDGSLCLQEELCMEYQYPNLFMQLPNTKDY